MSTGTYNTFPSVISDIDFTSFNLDLYKKSRLFIMLSLLGRKFLTSFTPSLPHQWWKILLVFNCRLICAHIRQLEELWPNVVKLLLLVRLVVTVLVILNLNFDLLNRTANWLFCQAVQKIGRAMNTEKVKNMDQTW